MSKLAKYLVPFCARTGGLPHYIEPPRDRAARAEAEQLAIVHGTKTMAHIYGSYREGYDGEVEWREAAPFAPAPGVVATGWARGRSAANMLLGGPVLALEKWHPSAATAEIEVRATYYLTQAGLLTLLESGAFDGPALRPGVLLRPVKRGQNYLVEFGGWTRPNTYGGPLIVAVDFDGTVYAGPWTAADECTGEPNPGAIQWLIDELNRGHRLIIHTCRLTTNHEGCTFPVEHHRDPAKVVTCLRAWFMRHGMSSLEVDALEFWTHPGKPLAHEYLDDKAVRYSGTFPRRLA